MGDTKPNMMQKAIQLIVAYLLAAYSTLQDHAELGFKLLDYYTHKFDQAIWGESRASQLTGKMALRADRGQLGIFGVLVFGAIALVVVSIVLLFGMDIAGEFADGIDVDNDYSDEANDTVNSTGNAFQLFGTSVLVIPAAAVLTVLIGGMLGAVMVVGGNGGGQVPGMGQGR